jgi:predicted DNA-binding protein (UPF0251 family)
MTLLEDNELDNIILGQEVLSIAKSVLSERELDILMDYTLTSITYNELGREYGISGNRIMQIIDKSKRKVFKALSYVKWVYKNGHYVEVSNSKLFDREFILGVKSIILCWQEYYLRIRHHFNYVLIWPFSLNRIIGYLIPIDF